ncbi:MAG TPA: alpha/beta fold hydrolase [Vicinamibacterales bacterium]
MTTTSTTSHRTSKTRKKPAPIRTRGSEAERSLAEQAVHHTLALNPLIGVRRKEIVGAAATLMKHLARRPQVASTQYARLMAEGARIAIGSSTLTMPAGDRRFADPAWTGNAMFRRMLQSYVAVCSSLDRCVDEAKMNSASTERARFVVSLFEDAIAPTNFLATNPTALKKLVDSKGTSVLRGFANFVDDLASGTGLPRQVDARSFALGKNLATTPGAVVYRNELLELIQYAPTTAETHERPLLIVPPQINKYYVFDLSPAQSLVQWALASSVTTFVVSWRNPSRKQADCGIDAYVEALEHAVDAAREICGSRDVNVFGACSGGITLSALLGYLAAGRERKIHAATLAVCVLDTSAVQDTTLGLFVSPGTIAAAKAASRKRGVVEGADLARMFAWMRPNDLVWNYVVNNYLLGNEPPAHDILFWNNDSTRLPAGLHADFLDLFRSNPFPIPGKLRVRGRKIDLGKVGIDTYVIGGLTDHITTWQGVYRTAKLYGASRSTFVLANGGHIQSLINPPGHKRSWFVAGPARAATPEAWLKRVTKIEGTWWPHWRAWLQARSGARAAAPVSLGSARHPPIVAAPGTYVLER